MGGLSVGMREEIERLTGTAFLREEGWIDYF